MKIAITGHTKGIGKCIFDNIISDGFSRTNGFDITKPDTFIDSIKNFDVFINNTFHPTYQKEVFEKLFNIWKYEEKTLAGVPARVFCEYADFKSETLDFDHFATAISAAGRASDV